MTSAGWTRLVQLAQSLPIPNILLGQQHLRSAELQIRNSNQPRLWLEVTLMGLLPSAQGAIAPSTSSQASPTQPFIPPARNIPPTAQFTTQSTPQVSPQSSVSQKPVAVNNPLPSLPIPETPLSSGSDDFDDIPSVGYDLAQLWQSILMMLPTPTKSVFIQIQAHILTIDSNSVKIGLAGKRDETTKNIVVQKRPELEQVFTKHLQRPIKVMFAFVNAPSQEPQVQVTAPLPISPAIAPPPFQNPQPIANPTPAIKPEPISQNTFQNSAPIMSPVPSPNPSPNPQGYVGLSDEEKVVRNMAEFFNGQIVDLEEEVSEGGDHQDV
jgi:DNA polymerase-3 subunit gamma/tau